jgi:hypothetical protein
MEAGVEYLIGRDDERQRFMEVGFFRRCHGFTFPSGFMSNAACGWLPVAGPPQTSFVDSINRSKLQVRIADALDVSYKENMTHSTMLYL